LLIYKKLIFYKIKKLLRGKCEEKKFRYTELHKIQANYKEKKD